MVTIKSIIEDKIMSTYVIVEFKPEDNQELANVLMLNYRSMDFIYFEDGVLKCAWSNQELNDLVTPHWQFIIEHELSHDGS
jgi:hypothetical protein